MLNTNKVVWFEGMFLQPQHFQQQDRHFEEMTKTFYQSLDNHLWGFSELELDLDLLSLGKIGLAKAKGIFPDGTAFDLPRQAKVPTPLMLTEEHQGKLLYLAIPLKQANHVEIGDDSESQNLRYEVADIDAQDVIVSNNQVMQIQVGQLACQFLTDLDDLSDYTCLAIARINEVGLNQVIKLDQTFMPSCLAINVIPSFDNLLKEVHGLLHQRAEMLAGRLTDSKAAGTAEVIDFMLLQIVNRYEALFHSLCHKQMIHPEKLFTILIQLIGELATFTNNKRRPPVPPIYRHDDLYESFKPIVATLRHALSMVLEQNATAIKLHPNASGVWVGQINDKSMLQHCQFILGVYADLPIENIRNHFPSQIKILPCEKLNDHVKRGLPGIGLAHIAVAPRQIPYHANFSYFTINKNHELWSLLTQSAGLAFHIGNHFPGLKLELWAIKG